ncbi:hypothetical protein BH09MYX1_BH09MYX1_49320 [soil metagenome]
MVRLRSLFSGSAALLAVLAFAGASAAADAPPASTPVSTDPASTDPASTAPATTTPAADADADAVVAAPRPTAMFTSTLTADPSKDKDKVNAPKAAEPLRWADTQFFQQVGITPNVLSPGSTQSSDVTVDTYLLFQPRFTLTKEWQVRLRLTGTYEFTNNANSSTTREREFRFGDAVPSLWFRGIPAFAGFKLNANIGVGIPLSVESQARTMIVSPSVGLQLAKPIEHFLGGEAMLILNASFAHPFYRYTTAGVENAPGYQRQCASPADFSCGLQASGASNPANILSFVVAFVAEWGKFNPGLAFLSSSQWTYDFKDISGVQRDPSRTNLRQTMYASAWIDYNWNSWFTTEVGYQISRNVLNSDGTYGNPVYDAYNGDMRVYLGINVGLDKLYQSITGDAAGGGVVRTQNEKKAISTY